jgi:hypothetical protein
VLLGTPHRGTGDFTSQALVLRIINAEIPVELTIVDVLKPKNETLIDLFDDFTNLIADDKIRVHLRVFCFFEQKPTTASDVLSKVQGGEKLDKSIVRVSMCLLTRAMTYLTKYRSSLWIENLRLSRGMTKGVCL